MTREQKLGLIAGFTVVLLFGVLLADHLSRARTEPLLVSERVDEPLVIPPLEVPTRIGASSLPTQPRVTVSEPLPEPVSAELPETRMAERDTPADRVSVDSIFERVSTPVPQSGTVILPGFEPVGRAGTASVREPVSAPVRARTHEVKRGETLFAIAERYYGNGHLWRELLPANAGVVESDGRVAMGVVLTIPNRGEATSAPTRVVAVSEPARESTYTVQSGDTLSEISVKLLGTTKRMDELITLNRDQIRDADDIRVGMKLRYRPGPSA